LRSPKPRQLRFAFADSPDGGGNDRDTGGPVGRSFLLRIANARSTRGFGAPAAKAERLLDDGLWPGLAPWFRDIDLKSRMCGPQVRFRERTPRETGGSYSTPRRAH
jgi:hypothetical protein